MTTTLSAYLSVEAYAVHCPNTDANCGDFIEIAAERDDARELSGECNECGCRIKLDRDEFEDAVFRATSQSPVDVSIDTEHFDMHIPDTDAGADTEAQTEARPAPGYL